MSNRYIQTLIATFLSLFFMMGLRIFFLFRYPETFASLTKSELLQTLLMGFRIDLVTFFTFVGVFIILLTLPLKTLSKLKVRKVLAILWALILFTILLVSMADILYFEFSRRHLSSEVFHLGNDTDLIVDMVFGSYVLYSFGSLLFLGGLLYAFSKIFHFESRFIKKPLFAWFGTFLIVFTILAGIRGNVTGSKSLGVADAFAVNKACSGNLALNGFFCVYRSTEGKINHVTMDTKEALKKTQELLYTPKATFTSEEFPLMRSYKESIKKDYNIVIVLLESFGAEHLDGFTHYPELGVTPYFKELSQKSLKFNNFYSNGYRSIFGITSIFTGVSLPAGFDYLGTGLELSNLSYLGQLAKENGYDTLSMQGSNRRSYRVDAVSHLAGFDEYYGAEDIPNVEEVEEGRSPNTGTFDHNLLQFYHKKINTLKEPFISFAFTTTTHSDYHLPSKKYEKYPHDLKNYNGTLNTLYYADSALKRFMQQCEKEPWFDNTIFIFTSDHGSGDAANPISENLRGKFVSKPAIEHFRIPLLMYAPKIFKAQEIDILGSQVDIFPTIVDYLGWKGEFTVLGNSLFDTKVKNRFVLYNGGHLNGIIKPDGFIVSNYRKVIGTNSNNSDKLFSELNAVGTTQADLIQRNRWFRP
ncbi:LTA synthase family protein [Campylobacterota bacterium]